MSNGRLHERSVKGVDDDDLIFLVDQAYPTGLEIRLPELILRDYG